MLGLRTVELVSDLATLEYIDEVRYGGLEMLTLFSNYIH